MENTEYVKQRLSVRSGKYDVDAVLDLYNTKRTILKDVEQMKAVRNRVSGEIAVDKRKGVACDDKIAQMQELGDRIRVCDEQLAQIEPRLRDALLSIPNLPAPTVPIGESDSDNKEIRRVGQPRKFAFEPKPHWDIGENLNILDFSAAAKISGARFTVYRGAGARLERALISFMLDTHNKAGYTEIFPPFMVNRESMYGTGQLPKFEEDAFAIKNNGYFLVPTAEVPVTNLLRGETVDISGLPIKYCAYTSCFRAEAGSAGRDTRGLIRQHQFNKVELVKFTKPDDSFCELEALTADAERILQQLGLAYRVVLLSSGDLGFCSRMTYDLEVYMPSYNRYVEISSCSDFGDYQARRMNIKYRDNNTTGFLHTLNGSGLAVGRTTAAILETFQNEDGSVTIPDALIPYMGTKIIDK